jgi:hypothetical protein
MLEFKLFWYSCKDFVDKVEQDVSFDAQDFHVFRDDFFEKFKKSILFWNHQLYK